MKNGIIYTCMCASEHYLFEYKQAMQYESSTWYDYTNVQTGNILGIMEKAFFIRVSERREVLFVSFDMSSARVGAP